MSLTFKRAERAVAGTQPTSAQHNALAQAFMDRLLSGVADGPYRIAWYLLSLVRQPRNPVVLSDDPPIYDWFPVDEWLRKFGLIDPIKQRIPWPQEADPGEEQGLNLSFPAAEDVFGNSSADLGDENSRFDYGGTPIPSDATLEVYWAMGKLQRGFVDLGANAYDAPFFSAATATQRIGYWYLIPYLKTYGGFLPTPRLIGGCGDGSPESPMYELFFTSLHGAPAKRYSGFCPNGATAEGLTPIWGLVREDTQFTVYRWDGAVDILSASDWIEGPYRAGARLQRKVGEQLGEGTNRYVMEFRGSTAERAAQKDGSPTYHIKATGFGNQQFLTQQYFLSPARGTLVDEFVEGTYPRWRLNNAERGVVPAGTALLWQGAGSGLTVSTGFVLAGVFVKATGVNPAAGSVIVEVLVAGVVQERVSVVIDSAGNGQALAYWKDVKAAGSVVTVRFGSAFQFSGTGEIAVEAAEIFKYQPYFDDLAAVLRSGTTSGGNGFGMSVGPEGFGTEFTKPKQVSDDYFRYGCVVNRAAAAPPTPQYIGDNPRYEGMRRLVIDNLRLGSREKLVGYKVDGDGNSVLYWDRFVDVYGEPVDIWKGIGPDLEPVSTWTFQESSGKWESGSVILDGMVYEVRGGREIQYNGVTVPADSQFTGVEGVQQYFGTDDTTFAEQVYRVDGVWVNPPLAGRSNRWCLFWTFGAGRDDEFSDESIYKLSNYNDSLLTLMQRCHLASTELEQPENAAYLRHFAYGQKPVLLSEAPDGYRYAGGLHHPLIFGGTYTEERARQYYRSCRIYEAPYELKRVRRVVEGGVERIEMTLNGRLRHCPDAPDDIARDISTWDWLDDDAHRLYRTDENGVMDYLRHWPDGGPSGPTGSELTGDTAPAPHEWISTDPGKPHGFFYPRGWFVRLPETVREEAPPNVRPEAGRDARTTVDGFAQMEMMLRAMCEGFINSGLSEQQGCESDLSFFYDFTYGDLIFAASGGTKQWITLLPAALRGDLPKGYSMEPNTRLYVETFNQWVDAVNLLDKARVLLPILVEARQLNYFENRVATPIDASALPGGSCTNGDTREMGSGEYAVFAVGTEHADGSAGMTTGDWGLTTNLEAGDSVDVFNVGGTFAQLCSGSQWRWALSLQSGRTEYRVQSSQIQFEAIPAPLLDLLQTGNFGILGRETRFRGWWEAGTDGARCNLSDPVDELYLLADGAGGRPNIRVVERMVNETVCVSYPPSGTLAGLGTPAGLVFAYRCGGSTEFYQAAAGNSVFTSDVAVVDDGYGGSLYLKVPLRD